MSVQIINESFIDFIEEKQINVPEDFIDIFLQSITMNQWIDSETAKKYLQYARQDNFNQAVKKFILNEDYKQISREEYEKNRSLSIRTGNENKKQQNGGQNKKYFLITRETFKTMLLMRDSENGKKYRRYMITLEKIFFEFMIQFFSSKENLIEQLQKNIKLKNRKLIKTQQQLMETQQEYEQELQERDNQLMQYQLEIEELEDKIDQEIYKFNVIKIFKVNEHNQQEEIDHPQIICYTSNTNMTMKRYSRLLNKYYKQTFVKRSEVLDQNLDRKQAIQSRDRFVQQYTGQEKIYHNSIQNSIPLFAN